MNIKLVIYIVLLLPLSILAQQPQGNWIGPDASLSVVELGTSFSILKPVRSARLSITALGIYHAAINGTKVCDAYFTPGWTSYRHLLQYQLYDVTKLIHQQNSISVLLNKGWYSGSFGGQLKGNNYGESSALNCSLVIEFKDGTKDTIRSDAHWKWRNGYIISSDFYSGELQDFNASSSFKEVQLRPALSVKLVSIKAPSVSRHEQFKPLHFWKDKNGGYTVDFGQNLAGFVELKVRGNRGDTITIEHAEILNPDSTLYLGNLRLAKARDVYILDGKVRRVSPYFTYHGFRYARIRGSRVNPRNVTAVAIYSDLQPTGTFSCSDSLVNQLYHNILWSMKSNFVDIPTDCPQRSERYGWTGDAQVFCRTAAYNYYVLNFYNKWLADLAADQGINGAVPAIIPDFIRPAPIDKRGFSGWGDAATIIPWELYQLYGDTGLLCRQYGSMKAWVDYIQSQCKDGLWLVDGYGDWYAQGDSTSLPYINQCFFVHSAEIVSRAAKVLGKTKDMAYYQLIRDAAHKKYLATYRKFDTKATSTQTAYLLALQFNLLPFSDQQPIADKLAISIRDNKDKLATGFLGTPYLLPVLSRFGYTDLAYTLLFQKECPSWLYPITKGATTIWEKWDAIRPDGTIQQASFNHFAYGAVGQWFYEGILGIHPMEPGFKKIKIAPQIGKKLTWAKGSYQSASGTIHCAWRREGKQLLLDVIIPAGMIAKIIVPSIAGNLPIQKWVGAGKYHFKN